MNFTDRTGEKFKNKSGENFKIIQYFNSSNCTIIFEDGVIRTNISYSRIKNGNISKKSNFATFQDRVGEEHITNQGYKIEIIVYRKESDCDVLFLHSGLIVNARYKVILKGRVENPFHKTVFNTGYLGVGDFKPKGKIYETWRSMLRRCYCKKILEKNPTYKDVVVCEEWHNFQVFGKWYDDNWKTYMVGWELDKDILEKGNKTYSPETCCFVPRVINSLYKTNSKKEKDCKIIAEEWKTKIDPRVYHALIKYNKKEQKEK